VCDRSGPPKIDIDITYIIYIYLNKKIMLTVVLMIMIVLMIVLVLMIMIVLMIVLVLMIISKFVSSLVS